MPWRPARSLAKLQAQVNAEAPSRSKASDGMVGDASHQAEATGSDHNPNAAGVVCAFDITHDPAHGMDVGQLAESLLASRDNRIKYLIFNHRTVDVRYGWYWQDYNGSNPHTSHLHVSVQGNYDDTRNWSIGGSNNQGDDMSEADQAALARNKVDARRRDQLERLIMPSDKKPSLKDKNYGVGGTVADVVDDLSQNNDRYELNHGPNTLDTASTDALLDELKKRLK